MSVFILLPNVPTLSELGALGSAEVSTFGRRIKIDKESVSELEDDNRAHEASAVEQEEEDEAEEKVAVEKEEEDKADEKGTLVQEEEDTAE